MSYNIEDWEFSHVDESEIERDQIPDGWRTVKIVSASYDDSGKYSIRVEDLDGSKASEFTNYYLLKAGEDGSVKKNGMSVGSLVTLGKSLFEMEAGFPPAHCIIGGVVRAEVKHNTSKKTGRQYMNIYKFEPAPEAMVLSYSDIDQYYVPDGEEVSE